MADSLLSYAITIGVFIGLVVILSASRAKRTGKKQTLACREFRGNQTFARIKNRIDLLALKGEFTIVGYAEHREIQLNFYSDPDGFRTLLDYSMIILILHKVHE